MPPENRLRSRRAAGGVGVGTIETEGEQQSCALRFWVRSLLGSLLSRWPLALEQTSSRWIRARRRQLLTSIPLRRRVPWLTAQRGLTASVTGLAGASAAVRPMPRK